MQYHFRCRRPTERLQAVGRLWRSGVRLPMVCPGFAQPCGHGATGQARRDSAQGWHPELLLSGCSRGFRHGAKGGAIRHQLLASRDLSGFVQVLARHRSDMESSVQVISQTDRRVALGVSDLEFAYGQLQVLRVSLRCTRERHWPCSAPMVPASPPCYGWSRDSRNPEAEQ